MKTDRLFAYSPNLKQSWMLQVRIFVYGLIVYVIARLVFRFIVMFTGISTRLMSGWKHLAGELLFFVVSLVIVIRLGKNSKYVPVASPRQSPLLWLLLVPFTLSIGPATELLTMWIPKIDIIADFISRSNSRYQFNLPTFLLVVVIAPLSEEWLHRGIILKGLLTHYSPLKAIIWSSVIFGVMHVDPRLMVYAFCGGLAMGWVYWRTRSLWCCIFMHAANNVVEFWVIESQMPRETTLTDLADGYYISAVALLVCALTGMWIKNIMISPAVAPDTKGHKSPRPS